VVTEKPHPDFVTPPWLASTIAKSNRAERKEGGVVKGRLDMLFEPETGGGECWRAGVLVQLIQEHWSAVHDFRGEAERMVRPSGLELARSGIDVVTSISAAAVVLGINRRGGKWTCCPKVHRRGQVP